ncbi:MAG: hypothetical protein ACOCP8_00565 [archaeon]
MQTIQGGLTCNVEKANYVVIFNDEEYYIKEEFKAKDFYNELKDNKNEDDLLKMFKYKKMPDDSHIN